MNDESSTKSDDRPETPSPSLEERIITLLLMVGLPFLISFISFGVIVLAYSQWKLY